MEPRRTTGGRSARARKAAQRGLAGFRPAARQKPARSPFEKAGARLSSGRQSKQSGRRAVAAANVARGLISQGGARGSKKGPAALAVAAAGAGGIALARRRKAGAATDREAPTDTTLHVSSDPVEAAGVRPEGDTDAPPPVR